MHSRSRSLRLLFLAAPLCASACLTALGVKQKDGLQNVDELLSHVERLQVESSVSKERAQSAFESLRRLVAPEFKGDPASGHAELVGALEQSKDQAEALQDSLRPLRKTAESVFERWTRDLESFGNLAMRQRSQERLEETRRRYDVIVAAAVAAQLAYDSFNGDLNDHALFLEHDFNATSVALMAQELDGVRSRGKELAKRLDACVAACQAYVEFSAPSAQVAPPVETPAPAASVPAAPAQAAPSAPAAPKKVTLPPKKKPAPAPAPTPAPAEPKGG